VEAARPATADDLTTVLELARALRAELADHRGGALWTVREAAPEPLEPKLREVLDRSDALLCVGTFGESVVGYGTAELETLRDGSRLGIIAELFVEREARAVGVGEAIAEQLVAFCADAGCAGIDATALPGDREAKNFFERAGFVARKLTMFKRLDPSS
jgi:GNAT superfamily N-acetyltransferase